MTENGIYKTETKTKTKGPPLKTTTSTRTGVNAESRIRIAFWPAMRDCDAVFKRDFGKMEEVFR